MYFANVPTEAAPSSDSDDDEDKPQDVSESAEAITKVALAHADTVVGLGRDYGVPVALGCLRNPEGQNALGAAVRLLIFFRVSSHESFCHFQAIYMLFCPVANFGIYI